MIRDIFNTKKVKMTMGRVYRLKLEFNIFAISAKKQIYPSHLKMQNSAFHRGLISRRYFARMAIPFKK